MATKSQYRITATSRGDEYAFASMRLTKHGDLILALKVGDRAREFGRARGDGLGGLIHDKTFREWRYTVHPSRDSAEISRINVHLVVKEEEFYPISAITTAIKSKSGFALLYSRYGAVEEPPPPLGGGAEHIHLGEYDHHALFLHHTVFVSSPDVVFPEDRNDINVRSLVIGDFRLTVLWSFFPNLAIPGGSSYHRWVTSNAREDGLQELETLSADQAVELHRARSKDFYGDTLLTYSNMVIFDSPYTKLRIMRSLRDDYRLFLSGSTESPEYLEWKSIDRSHRGGHYMWVKNWNRTG